MKRLALLTWLLMAHSALAQEVAVTDDVGRNVTIPEHPARIVVMHEALLGLPLLDLGVNPIASYGRAADGTSLTPVDFIDTVMQGKITTKPVGFGAIGQIDLEKLNQLAPDLILAIDRQRSMADQLSNVAPVYLQNASTGRVRGFGVETELAQLLGYEDAYAARLKTYETKLEAVKSSLAAPVEGKTYLAVMITDKVTAVGEMSGIIQAIEDLGYQRETLEKVGATNEMGATFSVPLSPEIFGMLNPDLMIIMNSYAEPERDEAATKAKLDKLVPGWDKFLKPAREGRVMYIDSATVSTPTIASALHALDAYSSWSSQ